MAGEKEIITSDSLNGFLNSIDKKSRKIYWHIRCHGHAKLAELTELIGAEADMEVLYRIREIINPAAAESFGKPLLEFHESRVDRITGYIILFQWWLSDIMEDNPLSADECGKPLVDIFDEEDQIIIVSEISPSITVSNKINMEQRHGILYIRLDKLHKDPGKEEN